MEQRKTIPGFFTSLEGFESGITRINPGEGVGGWGRVGGGGGVVGKTVRASMKEREWERGRRGEGG
jgi:hypothetical protein